MSAAAYGHCRVQHWEGLSLSVGPMVAAVLKAGLQRQGAPVDGVEKISSKQANAHCKGGLLGAAGHGTEHMKTAIPMGSQRT